MARPPDGRAKRRPGVDAQRRHLLDTAIVLFAERGSRQVSINDLCAAAEVSRPTFYRCFTDKDGLVEALYREAVMGPIESIVLSSLTTRAREPGWLRRANDEMLDAIFAEAPAAGEGAPAEALSRRPSPPAPARSRRGGAPRARS